MIDVQSVGHACTACGTVLHVATAARGCARCGTSFHLECVRATAAEAGGYRSLGETRCERCGDRTSEVTLGDAIRRGGIDVAGIERRVKILFFSLLAFLGILGSAALAYLGFTTAYASAGASVAGSHVPYFIGLLGGIVGMVGVAVGVIALRLPDDELVVFRTDPASGGRDPSF
jgi:hypothetical protein